MRRCSIALFASILIGILLVGCTQADMEGIVLEVTENEILFSENLSSDKYEEIKDKSVSEIVAEETGLPLMYLSYNKTEKLKKGHEVKVWIDGGINESYPAQATAKKIEIK